MKGWSCYSFSFETIEEIKERRRRYESIRKIIGDKKVDYDVCYFLDDGKTIEKRYFYLEKEFKNQSKIMKIKSKIYSKPYFLVSESEDYGLDLFERIVSFPYLVPDLIPVSNQKERLGLNFILSQLRTDKKSILYTEMGAPLIENNFFYENDDFYEIIKNYKIEKSKKIVLKEKYLNWLLNNIVDS